MGGEKVKFSAFVVQALATFAIAFLTSLTGLIYAWPSHTLENFVSNQTELSRPMSTGEVSVLGSLTNIGGMVATPFCGYLVNSLGRKYTTMIFGLPFVEAAQSIAFYRRVNVTSKEVEIEIRKIKSQLDPKTANILQDDGDDVELQATKELLTQKPPKETQSVTSWKFLRTSKTSIRALCTSLCLGSFSMMMGAVVLQVYAEPLFKEAVPSLNSNTCAILLAVDLLISCFVCAFIVDRFGRKFLFTYSSIGSGLLTFLLAAQLQFQFASPWVTVLLIYSYNFVYNLGAATVPLIFIAEAFLPEVRGLCNSIAMVWLWMNSFLVLMVSIPLVENFGLGPLFYGFSGISFLAALYSHYYVPETKGLPADAIQLLFLKK